MPDDRLIELNAGALEVSLCPACGGSIARFRYRGRDVMRPAGAALLEQGDVRAASCFPLVPFSGRIADARFAFRGRTYRLEPNFPPEPHAIHGQGWQNPWRVTHAGEQRAELALTHQVEGTPLHYHASQLFTLADDALEVEIRVSNTGDQAMPAGIGLHPYFVRTPEATLRTRLKHLWLADEHNIPRERVTLPEALDFSEGRNVAELELDNGFAGWDGRATLVWPEESLRLRIEAERVFGNLVIYVPAGEPYFCVEPASNANNGFNLLEQGVEDTGVRVLEPEQALSGKVIFRIV